MSTSSGISFSGLSSGLDTDSIVTALTAGDTTQANNLQTQQSNLALRQTAYSTISAGLSSVAQAAGSLNTIGAFTTVAATSSDTTIATISTTSSANVGNYDLNVSLLAKANKIATSAQIDTTSSLGKSGTASINGKAFTVDASDSLTAIAKKVNSLSAGVIASVVDGGSGRGYLTFSSTTTGVANAVSITDLNGTSMADLGLAGTGNTVPQTIGVAAVGDTFSSSSTSIQSLLGATGLPASTITIAGTTINVDPTTDTLDSLATKINAAGISGVTATVQSDTSNGSTVYKLEIAGQSAPPSMSETGGILSALGVVRNNPANELVPAQDASYTLDGVQLTSPTNSITGAISGATLTLVKAGTTNISLIQDDTTVTAKVEALVSAANSLFSTISSQSTFDSKTFQTGVLFGDSVANNAKDSVRNLLFSNSPGITGNLKNLASVGLGLDTNGNVTMDDSIFQAALDKDPAGVAALFQAMGTGSNSSLKYVSATSAAVASPDAGYAVNVTQTATQASFVAGTAQTSARTGPETLTFKGAAFGTAGISVDFEAGTDLAATIAKINADGRLKDLVTASNQNGTLRIDAKKYGTGGNFVLSSNFSSNTSNSGVGVGGEGTAVNAVDVAGTINGEAATGSGQFLTGVTGNATTDGLQIQVTGTATGNIGTINYSRGAASRMLDLASGFTDTVTGSLVAADKGLQTQIDGITADIATVNDRIASKTADLKARFAAMETALANLHSQSSTVSAALGTS